MIKCGKRYYLHWVIWRIPNQYMGSAAELCECDKIENYKKEIEENTYICKHHKIDHLFICKIFPNGSVFVVAMLSAFVIVSY